MEQLQNSRNYCRKPRQMRSVWAAFFVGAFVFFWLLAVQPALAYRQNKDTATDRQDQKITVGKGRVSINNESASGKPRRSDNQIRVRPSQENCTQPPFNGTIEVKPIILWPEKK